MLIKKIVGCNYPEVKRLVNEGVDIVIIEIPTKFMYKDEEYERNFRLALLADPSYVYKHPPLQGLLFEYEIWTPRKDLAKKIKKSLGWTSIGKPLSIGEYLDRLWYKIWEKIRRKLDLGGPFGLLDIAETIYCLTALTEKEDIEKRLASLFLDNKTSI